MTAQTAPASNLEQSVSALKNCLPYAFRQDMEGQHQLCWAGFDKAPLQEPFFARDVEARMFGPNPKFFLTQPEMLMEAAQVFDTVAPSGFIFHMSGCGSSLLANMLRNDPRILSYGEPNFLTQALAAAAANLHPGALPLFGAGVSVLGTRRSGLESHLVIKFSSFTSLFLPLVRKVFPKVPCLYLYRDPVEVLASNMRTPYQEWLFSAEITGLDKVTLTETNSVLHNCAAALANSIQAFLHNSDGPWMMADYREFEGDLLERVLTFFGIPASEQQLSLMKKGTERHAKNPDRSFSGDSSRKQEGASELLRAVAEQHLQPLYQELTARAALLSRNS